LGVFYYLQPLQFGQTLLQATPSRAGQNLFFLVKCGAQLESDIMCTVLILCLMSWIN